jgi:uncharacterized DUF497 family protein
MRITYDQTKRDIVLAERGLDLAQAGAVFDGFHLTQPDAVHSDVEDRFISVGVLQEIIVIVVWMERDDARRIITMWKANDKQKTAYYRQRDRPG